MNQRHLIQIMGLTEENDKKILKLLGFIFVEDRKQIVFNPSFTGQEKLHWTWHEDGMVHSKGDDGQKFHEFKTIPLGKFRGARQFLFSGFVKEFTEQHIDYKNCSDAVIFAIDLKNFKKGIGLSIHATDYRNINKVAKAFFDKPQHQSFILWKSTPKIVVHAFDN